MKHTKLSDHKFKKGKFITPMNSLPMMEEFEDEKSWIYGRMPEYLWIGLILKYFGRNEGFNRLSSIISKLHKLSPNLHTARMSQILKLDKEIQNEFFNYLVLIGVKESLTPLTIYLTTTSAPVFSKYFYCSDVSIEERINTIVDTMHDIMDHQSFQSTDIRFVALYFCLLSGRFHLQKQQIDLIHVYPRTDHNAEIMKLARPNVRSLESMLLTFEEADSEYINDFWRCLSEMTECNIFIVEFPKENRSVDIYMEKIHEVYKYLFNLYIEAAPLDEKMNTILGIATYSYKRFKEMYDYNLFNSISARSCVRVLIENYIMMKYLVKNEATHTNIWREYQYYGIGAYKLVLSRFREIGGSIDSHFDEKYIEALVNEFKNEEFIDMDTSYFDNQRIRDKAISVDEKNLYGLYYDYDSSYEHGMWGAIRESSLLKCNNPAHKYHCVPDINDEIILKSTLPDCIMVMNKTISYINELYGIPEQLLNEVINFELESITK